MATKYWFGKRNAGYGIGTVLLVLLRPPTPVAGETEYLSSVSAQSIYWGPDLVMGDVPTEESDLAWEALMPSKWAPSAFLYGIFLSR